MTLLNGKEVASHVKSQIQPRVVEFQKKTGRAPCLAVVLVGNFGPSEVYVRNKEKAATELGMLSELHRLPPGASKHSIQNLILQLSEREDVDGIMLQLPIDGVSDPESILNLIPLNKDADGLSFGSLGSLMGGKPKAIPCTPQGVMEILKYYKIPISGRLATVIGRSNIVGKPMAQLLLNANATVICAHSKTQNLKDLCQKSDIVIVAAGQKQYFDSEYFNSKSVVIDVGIHGSGSGGPIVGDVHFDSVKDIVAAITPVPGGVGPMTIACLLKNTMDLAEYRWSLKNEKN